MARPAEKNKHKGASYQLHELVRLWLDEEDLDELLDDDDEDDLDDDDLDDDDLDDEDDGDDEDDDDEDEIWDHLVLDEMCGETVQVRGVIVDRAVLTQRFSCVSDRCAPCPEARLWHSCCANAEVGLTESEVRRFEKHADRLQAYLLPKEPRLKELVWPNPEKDTPFYLDDDGARLCRPVGRCVFSKLAEDGRILCHLWAYAAEQKVERSTVQPLTCRIFPLVLLQLSDETPVLTVLNKRNHDELGANAPKVYPCLVDKKLPPIYESMADDLDWIFGEGFAMALAERARQD